LFKMDAWMDSDNASEVLLAKDMLDARSVIPSSWYGSSEVRTLHTVLGVAPILAITGNMLLSRSIANIGVATLLGWIFFLYLRSLGVSRPISAMTVALSLTPLSAHTLDMLFMGSFYTPYLIAIFVYLLFMGRADSSGKRRFVEPSLLAFAALLTGLSGTRYVAMLFLPVLLAELFIAAKPHDRLALAFVKMLFGNKRVATALCFLAACIVGMATNRVLVARGAIHYSDYAGGALADDVGFPNRVREVVVTLLTYIGGLQRVDMVSAAGIAGLSKIAALFWALSLAFRRSRRWADLPLRQKEFIAFFWISSFVNLFLLLFSTVVIAPRYHLISVFLLMPFIAMEIMEAGVGTTKYWLLATLVVTSILLGQYTVTYRATRQMSGHVAEKRIIEYLEKNDLRFGYATFWRAALLEILANGEIEIANIDATPAKDAALWLTVDRYYDRSCHPGKTFLLLTKDEARKAQPDLLEGSLRLVEMDNYVVFAWERNPFHFLNVDGCGGKTPALQGTKPNRGGIPGRHGGQWSSG